MATTEQAKDCKEAGVLVPLINQQRCEGKADCVRVCPYNVFEVRQLTAKERQGFSFFERLKLQVHGNKQAFAVRAADCHACGLCVQACPEKAIKLGRPGE